MKSFLMRLFSVGVLGVSLGCGEPVLEQAQKKSSGPKELPAEVTAEALKKAGFESLFNGKDLTGWRPTGGNAKYEVKDGVIRGYGENISRNTFLRTDGEYGDFVLVFRFKFEDRTGNSGCMFRALHRGGKPDGRVTGYQCEHDNFRKPQRSWTAGIFDEARRGWLYPSKKGDAEVKAAFTKQGERLFKWDDWNLVVIRCEGNHLQTWLNGEKRADFKDVDPKHFTAKGFIGLQVHGGRSADIRWKDLYLKKL